MKQTQQDQNPTALSVALKGFVAKQFADAADRAYQDICAQLNQAADSHPDLLPALTIVHDQVRVMRDTIKNEGQVIEKVYEFANAEHRVADKLQIELESLEESVREADDTHPLVGQLIEEIQEACYGEYGFDDAFTDQVNEKIGIRMASTLAGLDQATATRFIDIIGSLDKLLPDEIEALIVDALTTWADNGYKGQDDD